MANKYKVFVPTPDGTGTDIYTQTASRPHTAISNTLRFGETWGKYTRHTAAGDFLMNRGLDLKVGESITITVRREE